MGFFKGNIAIKFDPRIVCQLVQMDPMVRVISLDEDNGIPMLDADKNPQVVLASILLPPIEAMWAMADNDEAKFDYEYAKQLQSKECVDFLATIISAAYSGIKIIFYYPERDNEIVKYLYNYILVKYGIHMSIEDERIDPFSYNVEAIPIYLNMIYTMGVITPYDYLYQFPVNVSIPDELYFKIIYDLKPCGNTIQEKYEVIDRLRIKLKSNPNTRCPIISMN